MKEAINTEKAPKAIGPYSQGIKSSNMFFVSGQLPIDPKTSEISDDIKKQTQQSLLNLKNILEEAGLSLDNVVKTTVYLKDMNDFSSMNEVYAKFFNVPYPARAALEVSRMAKDAKVEIEAIAAY